MAKAHHLGPDLCANTSLEYYLVYGVVVRGTFRLYATTPLDSLWSIMARAAMLRPGWPVCPPRTTWIDKLLARSFLVYLNIRASTEYTFLHCEGSAKSLVTVAHARDIGMITDLRSTYHMVQSRWPKRMCNDPSASR